MTLLTGQHFERRVAVELGQTVKVECPASRLSEEPHLQEPEMSTSEVIQIARELILTGVLLTLPVIVVSLVVGLAISLFQTVTSVCRSKL